MIRWIVLALAVYLLYRLFANDFLKKRKKDEQEESKNMKKKIEAGEMVKDPECGAYVPVDDSVTVRAGDKLYHSCSYDGRSKYLKRSAEGGDSPAGQPRQ